MFRIVSSLCAVLMFSTMGVAQATWLVPGSFSTITEAVNASSDGDVIYVYPGVYSENIRVGGKAVSIISTEGPTATVIDGSTQTLGAAYGSTINVIDGEGSDTVIRGFTVTGGVGSQVAAPGFYFGGGILCFRSAPTISDCHFLSNINPGAGNGGGLAVIEVAEIAVANCSFEGNSTGGHGGGVYILDASASFDSCTFTDNTALNRGGAVHAERRGGVLAIVDFTECDFTSNSATLGGGGAQFSVHKVTLDRCRVVGNDTLGLGGGMALFDGTYVIDNCWIEGNTAELGGGLAANLEVAIEGTVFLENSAMANGGALYSTYQFGPIVDTIEIERCTFYGNVAAGRGGTLHHASGGTTRFHNSIIWADTGDPFSGSLGMIDATYCDIHVPFSGVGNISTNPLFVDVASKDFSLAIHSPCIDAGDPASPLDPDGTVVDMGAIPSQASFIRGDVNSDGVFDISDPVSTLFVLFVPGTLPPSCVDAGDSNDDGSLDVSDGIYSLAALFILGSPPPPEPHSACGPDVTADEITCQAFNCP